MEAAVTHSEGVALLRQVFAWLEDRDMDSFLAALHPDVHAHPSLSEALKDAALGFDKRSLNI